MKKILLVLLALLNAPAYAGLNVLACEPEWAALAQEIGGEQVKVSSATTALQDPHQIQARPSLIAKARQADLVICSGAELESGWLPQVLRQAANGKVQPGSNGYLEAALLVTRLDVPQKLDRAEGDVHAAGNPHVQLDPRNIAAVAVALAQRMAQLDAEHAGVYQSRQADFAARWSAAMTKWQTHAARLKGVKVITHHRNAAYLLNWLGMEEAGNLEPKPGIPPTVAHLQELLAITKSTPVRAILRMPYEDEHASHWLSERTQLPAVTLPGTVGGDDKAKDLFGLFDDTLEILLGAIK